MKSTLSTNLHRARGFGLALIAAVFCVAISAQSASAAATLNVTANPAKAGAATALTINTALSGTGNAKKQYGAKINLPNTFRVSDYPAWGGPADQCPPSAYSALNTGITPVAQAFSNAACPAAAKIGTATLGSASGGIYIVGISPLPQLGVYFDTGVATPYGRRLSLTWTDSAPSLLITGLPNTSTNGLTLSFDNPSRPNGLPTKFWGFVDGDWPECTPTSSVTGNVWTWPTSGTAATLVSMSPKTVSITGCGIGFQMLTDSQQAGTETALTLRTPLNGTGNDTKQYGARVVMSNGLLRVRSEAYGSPAQQCSPGAFSSISTGYTPVATAFSNASCPATARVGTATLGSASGGIYLVATSPLPNFGVYFDQGVSTPYGRRLTVSYDGSAPAFSIFGLPNASSTGLQLEFNNPSRPTLPAKIWALAGPGDPDCADMTATGTVYTYPSSGTATTVSSPMYASLYPTGC